MDRMDPKHHSRHKQRHEKDDRERSKRKHKSQNEGSRKRSRKEDKHHSHIVEDDPDEDLWVEKNIDMDGGTVRSTSSLLLQCSHTWHVA